jgi:single-stranded-DNA-specific exonuclease
MTPVFMTEDMQDTGYGKQVGEDKSHLRFTATQNGKGKIVGIGFGMGDQIKFIKNKKPFKAAYTIDENEWNGNKNLQLKLKDLKA